MCRIICYDSEQAKNLGLLFLRVGIGLIFMRHGIPKLFAGLETWQWLGSQMSNLGIHFAHPFWGFAVGCAESFGGLCLILGLGTRIATSFMAFVMFVALVMHLTKGDAWAMLAHPLSLLVVFVALIIMGAGSYSFDARCAKS